MPRQLRAAVVVVVAAVTACATPAYAGSGDGVGQGSGGADNGVLTAGVTYTVGGGRSDGASACTWRLLDDVVGIDIPAGERTWPYDKGGQTFHLWVRSCDAFVTYFDLPIATPDDLLPALLEQLRSHVLPKPAPVFQMLDRDFGWAYVKVPLDFRVDGDEWQEQSVTAELGPFWATVTAQPASLSFDPGDPAGTGAITCVGDGPTAAYVPDAPGSCSYTYLNASSTSPFDGYHFQTSLSIMWTIAWTSSTGAGGALPPFATTSAQLLAVAEVKGLVTCTGPRPEQGGC